MHDWFTTFDDSHWLLAAKGKDDEAEARFIKRALQLRRGQRVLDAPCGKGRIALHLARQGCCITGVDCNPRFLRAARRIFRSRGMNGTFVSQDLRRLAFDGEFDAALNWFGSFGYFSDGENLETLKRFAAALRPGGYVLVDEVNRERILRQFKKKVQDGDLTIRNRWDSSRQRVEGTWTWSERGQRKTNRSSIRLYTLGQLKRLFWQAGFEVKKVYGDASGSAFSRASSRLILVGKKP